MYICTYMYTYIYPITSLLALIRRAWILLLDVWPNAGPQGGGS